MCLYAVGRVIHQIGIVSQYGKHGPGFMLSGLMGSGIVMNLLLIVFVKSLYYAPAAVAVARRAGGKAEL